MLALTATTVLQSFVFSPSCTAADEISTDNTRLSLAQPDVFQSGVGSGNLSPGAREAAELLGIMPQVERLIQLRRANRNADPTSLSDEELALKVHVLDRIMSLSLEVRMTSDRIDRELAWAYNGMDGMSAKRQRNLNYLFTANFMQGGILGTVAGTQFLNFCPKTGTQLLLLGSAIGLGLSSVSLVESRLGSQKMGGDMTVLADVFDLSHPEDPHRPNQEVLRFLNSVPPSSMDKKTRRETLIDGWKKIHALNSHPSEKRLDKLAARQENGKHYREDIPLLATRIRLLFDTQWTIEQLDAELLDLLRAVDLN